MTGAITIFLNRQATLGAPHMIHTYVSIQVTASYIIVVYT